MDTSYGEIMIKREENNKNRIMILVVFIVLLLVPFLHISVRGLPYVYNDEFGYWASAAWFLGKDWSEVFSIIPYYSYGYGVILALLMAAVENMQDAYRLAVALNGLWLALSFVFLYKSALEIYPTVKKRNLIFVSAAATLFSSNFAQVNYTWPETFLFLLFCVQFYFIVKIARNPSSLKLIILAIVTAYSFCVHQRTLGIVVAVVVLVLILLIQKRISFRQIICFILPFTVGIMIIVICKSKVIENIWLNSSVTSGNNFSGQVSKVALIFSLEGIRNIILSFLGKVYYVFAATFFLVPFAVNTILRKWIFLKKKESNISFEVWIGIFLILALVFTIGINTLGMILPGNVTHIVYGRYTDNILGPFLLIAVIEFCRNRIDIKESIFYIVVYVLLSLSVYYSLDIYDVVFQAAINNAGIAYIVETGHIELAKGFIFVVGVWLMLHLIKKFVNNEKHTLTIISIALIAIFFVIGQKTYKKFELDWSADSISNMENAQMIQELCEAYGDLEIYVISNIPWSFASLYPGNGIQFLLPDYKIHNVDINDIESVEWPDNAVILVHRSLGGIEGFSIVNVDGTYELLISNKILGLEPEEEVCFGAKAHTLSDSKFYKNAIVSGSSGHLIFFDKDSMILREYEDILVNWIYTIPEENLIIACNGNRELRKIVVDSQYNVLSNDVLFESENLMIDPTIVKTSKGQWILTFVEVQGTVNNANANVENGRYTVHAYQSQDLIEWEQIGDIVSENHNIEDADMFELDGWLYYIYEKEKLDKKPSEICMKYSDDEGGTWSEEKIVVPADGDNEPAGIIIEGEEIHLYYSSDFENPGTSYNGASIYKAVYNKDFSEGEINIPVKALKGGGILLYDVCKGEDGMYFLYSKNYLTENLLILSK